MRKDYLWAKIVNWNTRSSFRTKEKDRQKFNGGCSYISVFALFMAQTLKKALCVIPLGNSSSPLVTYDKKEKK
ncbi:hypothetical protein HCD_04910 [Helicobacter cetorum MIT 99-5656]|uniref:Uncharacterized protein n=1 Tax=Helicobacter cetorum (strain ATCC BAA-540 / CCUG 52418 / MIT 99-5656) TaxID=1163745 RepID=I0ESR5_HELCM|nr:hypothetical protein HCD_04910 [Helicobacter cetorum MIT 99-5656]